MTILTFIIGLGFLIIGAEALVRGASRLASVLGISPLVIGLTVVAFGTSSPELAVSVKSVLSNQPNIAVGNVVGSNLFNVLFILGLSSLIVPLVVSRQLVRLDVPLMIGLSVLLLILSLDEILSPSDGFILIAGHFIYILYLFYHSRRESKVARGEYLNNIEPVTSAKSIWVKNITLILVGFILLVLGSRWLVTSSVSFAKHFGVSELVIGLTIVAAGTSLPELVTSIIAAVRKESDIAVGNVIGSNMFNIMGVLGVASIVSPTGVAVSPAVIGFDMPVMIAVALACLPIFFTGGVISRYEGAVLLGYYVVYTLYLLPAATHHDALQGFDTVMLYFIVPLTLFTLTIIAFQEMYHRNKKRPTLIPAEQTRTTITEQDLDKQ
ncbi:calcium/sodium antiporter [bacterium]|nr:calcium/sodium antiporter [bacterium]